MYFRWGKERPLNSRLLMQDVRLPDYDFSPLSHLPDSEAWNIQVFRSITSDAARSVICTFLRILPDRDADEQSSGELGECHESARLTGLLHPDGGRDSACSKTWSIVLMAPRMALSFFRRGTSWVAHGGMGRREPNKITLEARPLSVQMRDCGASGPLNVRVSRGG